MNRAVTIAFVFLFSLTSINDRAAGPEWSITSLPHRILIEVPAIDIGSRKTDNLSASVELDFTSPQFSSLKLAGAVDLDSSQVIRYDPATGKSLPSPAWSFARTQGELASRFIDKSLPWDFPVSDLPVTAGSKLETFPRGAFLMNARGDGTLYNSPAVDDWDGDGLSDLLVGVGSGNILLFYNEGDENKPKLNVGKYLVDAEGRILEVGSMASPVVADWNAA